MKRISYIPSGRTETSYTDTVLTEGIEEGGELEVRTANLLIRGERCIVDGDIKCDGNVIIDGAIIYGTIEAEGKVIIKNDAIIAGRITSNQRSIYVKNHTILSGGCEQPMMLCSHYGNLLIGRNVTIKGVEEDKQILLQGRRIIAPGLTIEKGVYAYAYIFAEFDGISGGYFQLINSDIKLGKKDSPGLVANFCDSESIIVSWKGNVIIGHISNSQISANNEVLAVRIENSTISAKHVGVELIGKGSQVNAETVVIANGIGMCELIADSVLLCGKEIGDSHLKT